MKWGMPAGWKAGWERYKYILLVVLVGAVLLALPGGRGDTNVAQPMRQSTDFDLEAMEGKLEQALSQVRGAGRVTVVLALRESARQVLAQDLDTDDSRQSRTTVTVSQGSGVEQPVLLHSIYPQYQGALVVCDGGGDPSVKLELLEAVRALTGLSSEKISICKRQ